jgi:hypothetical protein
MATPLMVTNFLLFAILLALVPGLADVLGMIGLGLVGLAILAGALGIAYLNIEVVGWVAIGITGAGVVAAAMVGVLLALRAGWERFGWPLICAACALAINLVADHVAERRKRQDRRLRLSGR